MGRKIAAVFASLLWLVLVCMGTFRLTFPSGALADRIRYEVGERTDYDAEVGAVAPWWVGASLSDVKLFDPSPEAFDADEGDENGDEDVAPPSRTLVALLKNARLRVSLWSMLRRAPYVSGSVTITESNIDFGVGTGTNKRGDIVLADLVVKATQLPLADLFMFVPGTTMSSTGAIDLDVDLHAGDSGMKAGSGKLVLKGGNVVLSNIEHPQMGALGMDVPIQDLSIVVDVENGEATFTEGQILSDLFKLKVSGTVSLKDPVDRSLVDIQITLSDLDSSLTMWQGLMADAKQADGTFQYHCRGVVSRLSLYSCSGGGRGSRATTRSTPTARPRDDASDADRIKRREELRDRYRSGTSRPPLAVPSGDPEDIDLEVEEIEDPDEENILDLDHDIEEPLE